MSSQNKSKKAATTTINIGSEKHMDYISEMAGAQKIPVTLPAFLRWLVEKEYTAFKKQRTN